MHLNYEYFENDEVTRRIFNIYISNCKTLQSFYPENYNSNDEFAFEKYLPKVGESVIFCYENLISIKIHNLSTSITLIFIPQNILFHSQSNRTMN